MQGFPGEQGLQGPQGQPGSQGIQGPQGTIGPSGSRFKSISIRPIINRYFLIVDSNIHLETAAIIPANKFANDAGELTNEFTDFGQNGYVNLFINAVLQQGHIYSVDKSHITLIPTGQTIVNGTPIIIESVGFFSNVVQE
jgi:hypothetical protein